MRWLWTAVTAMTLVFASEAHAQQSSTPTATEPEVIYPSPRVEVFADLTYTLGANTAACPDEKAFRDLVSARMYGTDTFKHNPRGVYVGRVHVDVRRTPRGYATSYTWVDAEGVTETGASDVRGTSFYHCYYMMGDVAVALTLSLGSLGSRLSRKYRRQTEPLKSTVMACPPAAPCPESPYSVWPREPPLPAPAPEAPKPERWPVAVRLSVGVWGEGVAKGFGSLGLSAEVGMRYRAFSAGVELHGDPPLNSDAFAGVGAVSFGRVSGALLLCGHYGFFVGCGAGDVGRFLFPNRVRLLPPSAFYGAAGVRAGVELPLAPPWLFLSAAFDLRGPIHSPTYIIRGTTVFDSAGPGVGAGVGLRAEIPR